MNALPGMKLDAMPATFYKAEIVPFRGGFLEKESK
jgi:hypothetical protein